MDTCQFTPEVHLPSHPNKRETRERKPGINILHNQSTKTTNISKTIRCEWRGVQCAWCLQISWFTIQAVPSAWGHQCQPYPGDTHFPILTEASDCESQTTAPCQPATSAGPVENNRIRTPFTEENWRWTPCSLAIWLLWWCGMLCELLGSPVGLPQWYPKIPYSLFTAHASLH